MKSTEFLQAAIDVQAERGKQYDKPSGERSMAATVSAFNCITGYTLEEADGWMFMGLLKLVRQSQNPEKYHHDSALDFVAYASLYAEAASEQCGQLEALSGVKFGDTPIEQLNPEDCAVVDPNTPSWDDAPNSMKWLAQDGAFPFAWVFFENEPFEKQGSWLQNEGKWLNKGPGKEPLDHLKTLQSRPTSTAK